MTRQKENPYSVVYSFAGRWMDPITAGEVEVFFRKRRPVSTPSRVFFYVGVPVKKIIGFADVERVESVDLEAALAIRSSGAISEKELVSYIGKNGSVSAIWIDAPTLFPEPFGLAELKGLYGFNPPQSFSNVSAEFESLLIGAVK